MAFSLEIDGLAKTYTGHGGDVEAIRDLTFKVRQGELVCVVGPSGAGKTTLLRCVAGLLDATGGQVRLDGVPVTEPPAGMAVVFQEYGRSLFPWLTVRKNVELPIRSRPGFRSSADAALEAVGLLDRADAHPWQLSGGMQQRVAIARAIAYEPRVLLMDEPFAAVDAQTRADLEDLVRALWQRLGLTVVFVTHDIDESVYLGQRVLVLSNRPTTVLADVPVDLPAQRTQLETRSSPAFAEIRAQIWTLVQRAKNGT